MTGHIFISYKTEQRNLAFRVRDQLQAWGYETWLDVDRLQPGTYWANDIDAALKSCWACLGIMTPTSIKSRYVTNEWDMAIMKDKLFIPLMFEKTDPHYKYVDIQYINFADVDQSQSFTQLKTRLSTYTSTPKDKSHADPYHDYLNATFERINKFLGSTLLHTLKDDDGQPEPIRLHQERTEGAVLFEKRDEVDPFFLSAGIAEEPLQKFDEFSTAFDHFDGRVLLLGEPGSGKTTTLFHYARDAVVKRRVDPNAPLPILALIVTWNAEKQTPLSQWVAQSYGAPENAKTLIEQGKALLLLDGLDELGGERPIDPEKPEGEKYDPRQRFIESIGNIDPRNNILVTCRIEDYAAIGEKIPLDGAITLQPLTDDQLRDYLNDHPGIYSAIQADDNLRELAKTPLLLSLITFAFDKLDANLKAQGDLSAGDVRDAIFEAYCKQRYEHEARKRNADLPFTYEEMMDILGELAMWNANDYRPGKEWGDDDSKPESNVLIPYDFEYVIEDTEQITAFQEMTVQLNILAPINDKDYRFVHLLLRDFLAYTFALTRIQDQSFWRVAGLLSLLQANPINALVNLGDRRAVEPLIACLSDENEDVHWSAIHALSEIGEPAIEPLIVCLSDESWYMRFSVARTLVLIGEPTIEPLISCLSDENEDVRSSAANALGDIGDSRAVELLIGCLSDENEDVRSSAASALGKIGDSRAVELLIGRLSDENWSVRSSAASALGEIGEPAIKPLIACLSDENEDVRSSAAEALGELSDNRAVEPLIACLSDEDAIVRSSAAKALNYLEWRPENDEREIQYLIASQSWDALVVKRESAVEPLIAYLSDSYHYVRSSAAQALGKIGDSRTIELLIACLSDNGVGVRSSVARALGEIDDPRVVEALSSLLDDKEETDDLFDIQRICDVAYEALQKIGTPEALKACEDWIAAGNEYRSPVE